MTAEPSHGVVASYPEPALFDTDVPHCARVYDYWLGGKNNFAVDRIAGDQVIEDCPNIVHSVRANRAFLARAVRFLAGEAGIHQFLDIGCGIPAPNNTHEVAQAVAPQSRVLYVDNDPIVLTHARALLASHPAGATGYVDADLRDPQKILDAAARMFDHSRPVAVLLLAILHHIDDEDDPYEIVATLMDAMPSGSYLALSHPAIDLGTQDDSMAGLLGELLGEEVTLRARPAVARFFDALELVEPGLVQPSKWRPASELEVAIPADVWAGVARK